MEDRVRRYRKEICVNCKNKGKGKCDIRITRELGMIVVKCDGYKSDLKVSKRGYILINKYKSILRKRGTDNNEKDKN